jgi:hypothetical protein
MITITTYNGIKLGLVCVPKDAYDFSVVGNNLTFLRHNVEENCGYGIIRTNQHLLCEIIGTTSTLTDEQVKELIKDFTFTKGVSGDDWYKCNTLNEFLEVNNIDTSKEYVILKLLNNE